jgi:hypothetical protein
MPKYVLTLRIGLNDSATTYEQAQHLREMLTEIALGVAPGGEGSVGASIEDQYQLAVKQTAAEYRLTEALTKQLGIKAAVQAVATIKKCGYVPQA